MRLPSHSPFKEARGRNSDDPNAKEDPYETMTYNLNTIEGQKAFGAISKLGTYTPGKRESKNVIDRQGEHKGFRGIANRTWDLLWSMDED